MRKVTFFFPAGSRAAGLRLWRGFLNALHSARSVNRRRKNPSRVIRLESRWRIEKSQLSDVLTT